MNYLRNPVFDALLSGDARFAFGNEQVKFFDEQMSPFAGFSDEDDGGFEALHRLLPVDRKILYATPRRLTEPEGWELRAAVNGLQFVFEGSAREVDDKIKLVPLGQRHAAEMVQLAMLTRPGPFGMRTIEFGNYFGVFENEKLVAMTGQRLHVYGYTEVSAVCTHPDYLGRGYAGALLQHELNLILQQKKIPFLHVRADNERAIALYERLGFKKSGPMNFYFLKRD